LQKNFTPNNAIKQFSSQLKGRGYVEKNFGHTSNSPKILLKKANEKVLGQRGDQLTFHCENDKTDAN
jgi:hypothetical protein